MFLCKLLPGHPAIAFDLSVIKYVNRGALGVQAACSLLEGFQFSLCLREMTRFWLPTYGD